MLNGEIAVLLLLINYIICGGGAKVVIFPHATLHCLLNLNRTGQ